MIVVFDLDGVLADHGHRRHYVTQEPRDYAAFYAACPDDPPIKAMVEMCRILMYQSLHQIEIWTSRRESSRADTEDWLIKHRLDSYAKLRMRQDDDHCKSDVLKERWLDSCFPCEYPDIVFEDSDRNTAMYRRRGIRCLQVTTGVP